METEAVWSALGIQKLSQALFSQPALTPLARLLHVTSVTTRGPGKRGTRSSRLAYPETNYDPLHSLGQLPPHIKPQFCQHERKSRVLSGPLTASATEAVMASEWIFWGQRINTSNLRLILGKDFKAIFPQVFSFGTWNIHNSIDFHPLTPGSLPSSFSTLTPLSGPFLFCNFPTMPFSLMCKYWETISSSNSSWTLPWPFPWKASHSPACIPSPGNVLYKSRIALWYTLALMRCLIQHPYILWKVGSSMSLKIFKQKLGSHLSGMMQRRRFKHEAEI